MRWHIAESILLALMMWFALDIPGKWHMAVVERELNRVETLRGQGN